MWQQLVLLSVILSQDLFSVPLYCRCGFVCPCCEGSLCIHLKLFSNSLLHFRQILPVSPVTFNCPSMPMCACVSVSRLGQLLGLLSNESGQCISNRTPDLSAALEIYGVTGRLNPARHTQTHTHTVKHTQVHMHARYAQTHTNAPETAGEGQARTSTHHWHKQTHSFCQSLSPSMFPPVFMCRTS